MDPRKQQSRKTKTTHMFGFVLQLILAAALVAFALSWRSKAKAAAANTNTRREGFRPEILRLGSRVAFGLSAFFALSAVIGTSCTWVSSGKFATLKRIYGSSMEPGQIVAQRGQMGPQARILRQGFHFELGLKLINDVDEHPVFTVPPGKCAILSAKDGQPIGNSAFAEPWTAGNLIKMANDAEFFLGEGKGQRGPQTTVLTPGSYTINPNLWEDPTVIEATRIEQATVGVVKSSVRADVDFGAFKRDMSEGHTLRVLTVEKLGKDATGALLVPVGDIGVWEEPLPNGLYYINTLAYKVTMVPTKAVVYEYKGGYKRRTVALEYNDKGSIVERYTDSEAQPVPEAADTAIFTKPEGWDVAQELRVMVQVSPEMAPFVVASLGLTDVNASQLIEDRVVTPLIRSVVRDVIGGAQIPFKQTKAIVGPDGKPVIDPVNGQPKTELVHEFRTVKVMDLLENRTSIEAAIEERAKPESLKEGVTVLQVLLSESNIPAELLSVRKRQQLAQQLKLALDQEQLAQVQRQSVENAKALAEKQGDIVAAEIIQKTAITRAEARKTDGEAEKSYLMSVSEGQKAQAEVLGPEQTAKLQMFQLTLKAATELIASNPEILTAALNNPQKFVPTVSVSGNGGLEGLGAVFGFLQQGGLKDQPKAEKQAKTPVALTGGQQ